MDILRVVKKYLVQITKDKNHRFTSWENCYQVFQSEKNIDTLSLQLAFYLASWGMYRGSSALLQKSYKIHTGAVKILLSKTYQKYEHINPIELSETDISSILKLNEDLKKYYYSIEFQSRGSKKKKIKASDTLLTKIILGSIGCTPAYDRLFILGLKKKGFKYYRPNRSSLREIIEFSKKYNPKLIKAQRIIYKKTKIKYPIMKIIDMYFWQVGYDSTVKKK